MIGTVTVVETQFERDLRNRHLAGALDPRSWTCVLGNIRTSKESFSALFSTEISPLCGPSLFTGFPCARVLEVN